MFATNATNAIIIRIKVSNKAGALSLVIANINEVGGAIGAIDIIRTEEGKIVRDITVNGLDSSREKQLLEKLEHSSGVEVINCSDRTFLMHIGGKIEIKSKIPLKNRDDLSMAYTPGVAKICMAIHEDPKKVYNLTIKRNMVAVITDGTAVLGLGDIGPEAALPVMEGKAMLFKDFGGVDAFPICLQTKDPDEIVETIVRISPVFGGINLEDISAPRCFDIEERLKKRLNIPVFHDDQHGTAVVLAAALINSLKITGKKFEELKIVVNGVGAAGVACTKILLNLGVRNIIGCDTKGAVSRSRSDLNSAKRHYVEYTNPDNLSGSLYDVLPGADVFIGLSSANVLSQEGLKSMNKDPIVFAMANPEPEIMPELAAPFVKIMATGRSDYPNQINNVLAFPGIFRGALDARASDINEEMKLAAAYAIAHVVEDEVLSPDYILPTVFDRHVVPAVAEAVKKAAVATGVAGKGV